LKIFHAMKDISYLTDGITLFTAGEIASTISAFTGQEIFPSFIAQTHRSLKLGA